MLTSPWRSPTAPITMVTITSDIITMTKVRYIKDLTTGNDAYVTMAITLVCTYSHLTPLQIPVDLFGKQLGTISVNGGESRWTLPDCILLNQAHALLNIKQLLITMFLRQSKHDIWRMTDRLSVCTLSRVNTLSV